MCQPVDSLQAPPEPILQFLVVRFVLEPRLVCSQSLVVLLHEVLQCALAAVPLDELGSKLNAPGRGGEGGGMSLVCTVRKEGACDKVRGTLNAPGTKQVGGGQECGIAGNCSTIVRYGG